MTSNVPLLRKVLDHITAHPEGWQQGLYAIRTPCGTAGCVAGNTAIMTGHKLYFEDHVAEITVDGRDIFDVAAGELGLNEDQAYRLFAAENSLGDLWRIASEITDGEIEIPATVTA